MALNETRSHKFKVSLLSIDTDDLHYGLNDEGGEIDIRTIEYRVRKFRTWLTRRKDYPKNHDAQKMIVQIDKYWEKLFADPVTVQTASGTIQIQP